MKEWFDDWFNTPFYHILYKNRNDAEARQLIDALDARLDFSRYPHIMDLACGKGRHSIYLNSKGYDVTGIDLSVNNINEACQFSNPHLHFFSGDMREVFRANSFDLILNLFTSFGYFEDDEDNQRTIDAVEKNLTHGGLFVIDYMNGRKAVENLTDYSKLVDGIHFHITKNYENGFINKLIRFTVDNQNYSYQERVKALELKDFERYFTKANLKIEHVWGDYSLNPYAEMQSDRLIISARKL